MRARSGWWRGDSQLLGFASLNFRQSFLSEAVEAAVRDVPLEFSVPRFPVMLDEPCPEGGQFLRVELFDFALASADCVPRAGREI